MMKNAFYFTLKTLFVLKLFKFCLSHVGELLDKKAKVDVINWETINYNTHTTKYLKNQT